MIDIWKEYIYAVVKKYSHLILIKIILYFIFNWMNGKHSESKKPDHSSQRPLKEWINGKDLQVCLI